MSITALALRLLRRGTLVWAAVVAVVVVSGVSAFRSLYPTAASRRDLVASLGSSPALDALYGRAVAIDTAGGFLAWRYGSVLATVVALWSLLAVTRLLRADEEHGRSDLVHLGPFSPASVLLRQLGGAATAAAAIGAVATLTAVAVGLPAVGSVAFGAMVGGAGALFAAVAAVTSQLVSTRRRAAGWAGAVLGVSFALRAVGDGSPDRRWLTWATPLGWLERISPYHRPSGVALAAVVGATVALGAVAVALRTGRDAGGATFASHDAGRRGPPLRGTLGLAWRLGRGAVLAWAVGMAGLGLLLGYLAADLTDYLRRSQSTRDVMQRYAHAPVLTVEQFLGLSFSVLGVVLALQFASAMVATREEEATDRLALLTAAGARRRRWLGERVALAVASTVALAVVGGTAAWVGVTASGASAELGGSVAGGLNVVPAALLFGGIGVAAFGLVPRATSAVAYGAVGLAYLVQTVGAVGGVPRWVGDLSPFTHVAPVPAAAADWPVDLALLGVAVLLAAGGLVALGRRDLQPE